MHVIDLLNSDVLDLPKTRDDDDFEKYVSNLLGAYLLELERVEPDDFISKNVRAKHALAEAVCADLKESVHHFLRGHPYPAYTSLTRATDKLGAHLDRFFPQKDMSKELRSLYRMCVSAEKSVSRKRLFHCPFELRHHVGTQRYSIPGLPCLYLGGSSLVCWREIREPAFEGVWISRFGVAHGVELRVVNLAYRPALMAAMVNANLQEVNRESGLSALVISYAACWPLMAVCAIRRLHDGPFAPEYMIPQMLLQWICDSKKFDGIRFFSTRTEEFFDDPKSGVNYVFPARTTPAKGFCSELTAMFVLSEPTRWNDALGTTPTAIVAARYKIRGNPDVELEKDFGRVESVLDSLPLDSV